MTGLALRSPVITLQAAALLVSWAPLEPAWFQHADYRFVPVAVALVWLAYHVRSVLALWLTGLAAGLWLFAVAVGPWHAHVTSVALLVLLGCAWHSVGLLHDETSPFGTAWRTAGMALLLVALLPMTFVGFHAFHAVDWQGVAPERSWTSLTAVILLAAVGIVIVRARRLASGWPVAATAVLSAAWLVAVMTLGSSLDRDAFRWSMAVVFSGLVVTLAVWLIVTGIRLDRGEAFFSGVVYGLLFVVVRWIDLIHDMLWSALLLFAAGGVLLVVARFWQRRRMALAPPAARPGAAASAS